MSQGMAKESGSLNGPLWTYPMRQNLHIPTCARSEGNVRAKFENDPWKITDVRALTGIDRPATRPPARVTTILGAAGFKKAYRDMEFVYKSKAVS